MALRSWEGDSATWQLFLEGNRDAFATLYASFAPLLYNYGCKQCADPRLVEDCIQDVFEYLLDHRTRLSPVDNVRAYLLKAYRRALLRKISNVRKNIPAALPDDACFEAVISPESALIARQSNLHRREKVKHALRELPPRMKEALFLRFYENLSFDDIAAIMDIDQRSVYKMIYKAFDKLRQQLADFPLWTLLALLVRLPG
ncbi:sigma-70 family RNA polymerase sigma factor [Chitinophaga agrisoli]|uniref:Sigma-70 family RNA polymerase sigma factor n=1 Tax=Chitinophaga agrisoli TaxID=2607653 RepID=A0A5B2VT15_9BACT|nr:sigma-70 family RNA polymerase sigma factor [Chitinophaga agrisoli]KAA2241416.1 sigma-70 family RNA polymerase sigma factor [Chitinophaga agrisoli]